MFEEIRDGGELVTPSTPSVSTVNLDLGDALSLKLYNGVQVESTRISSLSIHLNLHQTFQEDCIPIPLLIGTFGICIIGFSGLVRLATRCTSSAFFDIMIFQRTIGAVTKLVLLCQCELSQKLRQHNMKISL